MRIAVNSGRNLIIIMTKEKIVRKLFYVIFLTCIISSTAWSGEATNVSVQVLAKTGASWNGENLPKYPTGKPEITILRITIPAGVTLPMHEHPVINAGVLTKGELTVVTDDGKRLHLKSGDPIVEVVNKWHYGINEGKVPAEIIVFYAGTKGSPITVKAQ